MNTVDSLLKKSKLAEILKQIIKRTLVTTQILEDVLAKAGNTVQFFWKQSNIV